MSARVSASARVTVTVEIMATSTWGEDCPLSQIRKQAAEEIVARIKRGAPDVKVIGNPQVVAVLVEREA